MSPNCYVLPDFVNVKSLDLDPKSMDREFLLSGAQSTVEKKGIFFKPDRAALSAWWRGGWD